MLWNDVANPIPYEKNPLTDSDVNDLAAAYAKAVKKADFYPDATGKLDDKTLNAVSAYVGAPQVEDERGFITAAVRAAETLAGQLYTNNHQQASAKEVAAIALTLMDKAVNPDDGRRSSTLHDVVAQYTKLRTDAGITGKH